MIFWRALVQQQLTHHNVVTKRRLNKSECLAQNTAVLWLSYLFDDLTNIQVPVSVKQNSSGEEHMWTDKLSEQQLRGWRAVSAEGLQNSGRRRMTNSYYKITERNTIWFCGHDGDRAEIL